jgi:hypothetical protein
VHLAGDTRGEGAEYLQPCAVDDPGVTSQRSGEFNAFRLRMEQNRTTQSPIAVAKYVLLFR